MEDANKDFSMSSNTATSLNSQEHMTSPAVTTSNRAPSPVTSDNRAPSPMTSDNEVLSPLTSDNTESLLLASDIRTQSPMTSDSRPQSPVTSDIRRSSPVTSHNRKSSPVTSYSRDELLQTDTDYDTDAYSLENILRHYWLLSDREDDSNSASSAQRDASSSRKDNSNKWTPRRNLRQSSHDSLATIHRMMFDDDDASNKTLSTISEEDVNELVESFDTYSSSVDKNTNKNTSTKVEQRVVVPPNDSDVMISTNQPFPLAVNPSDTDLNTSNFRTAFEVNKSCLKSFNGSNSPDKSSETASVSSSFPAQPETVENGDLLERTLLPSWRYAVVSSPPSRPSLSNRVEVSSTLTSRALSNISRCFFSDYYPYTLDLVEHYPKNLSSDSDDSSEDEFFSFVSSQCSFKSPNCTSCDVTSFDVTSCDGNETDRSFVETNASDVLEGPQSSVNNIVKREDIVEVQNDSGCYVNNEDVGNQAIVSSHLANDLLETVKLPETMFLSLANDTDGENSDILKTSNKSFNHLFCAHAKSTAIARFLKLLPNTKAETAPLPNDATDKASLPSGLAGTKLLPNDTADTTSLSSDATDTATCATSFVNVNANGSNDFLAISSSTINAAKLATFKLFQVSDAVRHESDDIEVVLTTTCVLRRNGVEVAGQGHDSGHPLFNDSANESSIQNIAADDYVYKKAPRMKDLLKRVKRKEDSNTNSSFMTLEYSDITVSGGQIENSSTDSTVLSDISDMTYLQESHPCHSPNESYDFKTEDNYSKHKSTGKRTSKTIKNGIINLEKNVMHGGETRVRTLIRQNASNKRKNQRKVNIVATSSPLLKCKTLEVSFGDTSMESDDFGEHYYADVTEVLDEFVYTKPTRASDSKKTTFSEPIGANCSAGIVNARPTSLKSDERITFSNSNGACHGENCIGNIVQTKPANASQAEDITGAKRIDLNNEGELFHYDNYSNGAFLHPKPMKVNESSGKIDYNYNYFSRIEELNKFYNEKDDQPRYFVNDSVSTLPGLQRNRQVNSISSSDTLDTFISVPSSSVGSVTDSRCSFEFYDMSPRQKRKSLSHSQGSHETLSKSVKHNDKKLKFAQLNGSKLSGDKTFVSGRHLDAETSSGVTKKSNGQIASGLSKEFSDESFLSNNSSSPDTKYMFPDNMMDSILGMNAIMSLTNGLSRMKTCKDNLSERNLQKSSTFDITPNTSSSTRTLVPELSISDAEPLDKPIPEEAEDVPRSPPSVINEPKPIQKLKHAHLRKVKHMFRIFHLGHDDRDKNTNVSREKKPKEK